VTEVSQRSRRDAPISRVADYDGATSVVIAPTQLESPTTTRAQARRIYEDWLKFFSAPTPIEHLELASRVPQQLLDALATQPQLRSLTVKWGPYSDLSPLGSLLRLETLHLRGATRVVDLTPLVGLSALKTLALDGVFAVVDPTPLSAMTGLRWFAFGNTSMGSDAVVKVNDLEWLRPLVALRSVDLICVKPASRDLSPLLALPELERIGLSMRREFRKQVSEFAGSSSVFAELQRDFEERDRAIQQLKSRDWSR
jgi:hypothetical protein